MQDKPHRSQEQEFSEERSSLWRITFGPLVWAVHFVASYAATATFCAKWPEPETHIDLLRLGVGLATVAALVAIGWLGWLAWRQWDFLDDHDYAHADGNSEDRHEFLGHAAFLLAVVSFIGVVYSGLPALFAGSCR